MPVLTCPHDETENFPQALLCAKCDRRLSRVQVGGVFVQRYRVVSCLEETERGFRYLVDLSSQPCILEEIIPDAAKPRQSLLSFSKAVRRLIDVRPRCRVPALEYFSYRSCFYIVEKLPEGKSLRERIKERAPWPEEQAHSLLANLLSGLNELYSLTPPLYLGDISPETIIIDEKQGPLFLSRRHIIDSLEGHAERAYQELLVRDLQGCAWAVGAALAGSPTAEPERVRRSIANAKELSFTCTLEWLLYQHRKEPSSLQDVNQFRGLITEGDRARARGDVRHAIELFDHALHISRLPRLEAVLRELEKPVPSHPPRGNDQAAKAVVGLPSKQPGPSLVASGAEPARGPGRSNGARQKASDAVQQMKSPPPEKARSKNPGRIFLIVLLIIAGIVGWVWISGTRMRNFNSALARGQLVSPAGESAYDVYKDALASDGPHHSTVLEMNSKAGPLLHQISDQQFSRWHESSDVTTAEWTDLAKVEDWLTGINSGDVTSQARKAYADAELNFKHQRYADALSSFEIALQRSPNWDLAVMGIGKACFELQRYECTEQYYLKAKQLEPSWIWPHRNLMELYISPERRNLSAACAEYHQLISLSSSMAPPPFRREAVQKKMEPLCQ